MNQPKEPRPTPPPLTYRDAGVDIDAQDAALRKIRDLVEQTRIPGVLSELGSFGGLFAPDLRDMRTPVLVASADGVGTKLKIAFLTGVHNTVGRDLVHHCVNDVLVQGALPLFFLDYVATGRLDPSVLVAVVEGVARGCREAGCALLGGETAEMPGFYRDGEYDVAGFIVGMVDRSCVVDGGEIQAGDRLLGLPSAGLHTNGYSLARKIFFEVAGLEVGDQVEDLGATVGEVLLAEHRCYRHAVEPLLGTGMLRGMAHITGGGLTDNLPRILPEGTEARIHRGTWPVPEVFRWIQRVGGVSEAEMFRTFNMGIGFVLVVRPEEASAVQRSLDERGEAVYEIGEIAEGGGGVRYV